MVLLANDTPRYDMFNEYYDEARRDMIRHYYYYTARLGYAMVYRRYYWREDGIELHMKTLPR